MTAPARIQRKPLMQTPRFLDDKLREEVVACILDEFYRMRGRVLDVQHVPVAFQKMAGMDRVMSLQSGLRNTYEDKADFRAGDTGNLFVETWSKRGMVPGWAYTCGAQYLDWFVASHRTLLWGETLRLKKRLAEWAQRFPEVHVKNAGYVTSGLLVPICVVVEEAKFVVWDVPEEAVRQGIVTCCARRASIATQRTVGRRTTAAVGKEWERCQAIIPPTPKGRIAGIPYVTSEDVASILEHATQKQIVADKLRRDGEASEEWFRAIGKRLAPVIDQLRADGFAVVFDDAARTYRLEAAGESPVPPLTLFGESA